MAKLDFAPQQVDLGLYAGDGAAVKLTVKDGQGGPLDMTGVIAAQIRTTRTADQAVETFSADASAGGGVVTLSLTGTQTAALVGDDGEAFAGVWDVEWRPQGGEPLTLVQGSVSCVLDVTRT